MTPLVFGYVQARKITRDFEQSERHPLESHSAIKDAPEMVPLRERIGRTLIHWGEQLSSIEASTRHAA